MKLTRLLACVLLSWLLVGCPPPAPEPEPPVNVQTPDFILDAKAAGITLVFSEQTMFYPKWPTLHDESKALLKTIANELNQRDARRIDIGYFDHALTGGLTQVEAEARASALKAALIANGIRPDAVTSKGYVGSSVNDMKGGRIEIWLPEGKRHFLSIQKIGGNLKKAVQEQTLKSPPPAPPGTAAQAQPCEQEARNLSASHYRNYYQVFKVTEDSADFSQKPNAAGVFIAASTKSPMVRMSVGIQAGSPIKLQCNYMVTLDLGFEYVETRKCTAGSCEGKTQNFVRSVSRVVQVPLIVPTHYGSKEVSLVDSSAPPAAKHTSVTYSKVVVTVRRISPAHVAPAK